MKALLLLFLSLFLISHGWALPDCPTNSEASWDKCFGAFTYNNGDIYVGDWGNDLHHGQGTYKWPDGREYIGQWRVNKRNGGIKTYPNGDRYEGEWKDDQHNGQGTYTWKDGAKYSGEVLKRRTTWTGNLLLV